MNSIIMFFKPMHRFILTWMTQFVVEIGVYTYLLSISIIKAIITFFTTNIIQILLLVGLLCFAKKVVDCLQNMKTYIIYGLKNQTKDKICDVLNENESNKNALFKKQIMEELKQELKQEIYETCVQEWKDLWLTETMHDIYNQIKDEMKQTFIDQGVIFNTIHDKIDSFTTKMENENLNLLHIVSINDEKRMKQINDFVTETKENFVKYNLLNTVINEKLEKYTFD